MLQMTFHGGALGDDASGSFFSSIPGVSTAVDYIQGKAKAGAEQAIPDIQAQVKNTVMPYLLIALALGLGGLALGYKAYRKSQKKAAAPALSGSRRRGR